MVLKLTATLVSLFGILLAAILSAAAVTSPPGSSGPLVLRAEKLNFTPKEFYIADIIDERADKRAVAYLLPLNAGTAAASKAQPLDLQGGGIPALRDFIGKSLPSNKQLRPVIIRLKEMKVQETQGAAGRVKGAISVVMAFELERDGNTVPLLQYKGGGSYERPASKNEVAEPALRKSLTEALRYLNTWMDQEASTNEKLAKGIKVTFTDYTGSSNQDTVFYNTKKPLQWQDFKARPNSSSRFSAAVFPSFAYEGQREVIDGVIHLNLVMKVYVVQSASWVKDSLRNPYGLNHEQRHFDIVKLVSERFKQKIDPEQLSLDDYNSNVQYQFIESFREMNELQEQYDAETRHGIDKEAQDRWNQRLDHELKAMRVK